MSAIPSNPAPKPATDAVVKLIHSKDAGLISINGKQFRVTSIETRVNGKWETVALDQYDIAELEALAKTCGKIHGAIVGNNSDAESLSFYFERKTPQTSFFSSSKPAELEFTKLELKTADGTTKTEKLEDFDERIHSIVKKAVESIVHHNPEKYLPVPEKKSGPVLETLHSLIDETVVEAGSQDNRCAALSVAKRELAMNAIDAIVTKYKLPAELTEQLTAAKPDERVTILSNALITKAAAIIGNQDVESNPFLSEGSPIDPNSQRQPCFAAIELALAAHKEAHPEFEIPEDPVAAVALYATLIQDGAMLDLPFLLALEQPIVILQKVDNKYKVIAASPDSLTNGIVIVFNGTNHYQAIIPQTPDQVRAIRLITLTQQAVNHINNAVFTVEGKKFVTDLLKAVPEAKKLLIENLALAEEAAMALSRVPPAEFAKAARQAMGKAISPIVEETQ